jgi:hypothetical protein
MPKIFLSYRRADSQPIADRINQSLAQKFGQENVFKDVCSIPPGKDFRAAIESALIGSEIALIIIGKQWATITDASGKKRLENPDDFVRFEVEMALRHARRIIPVLVDNATMPNATDLPVSIQPLVFKNAAVIRHDPDFKRDIENLEKAISARQRWYLIFIAAVTFFLLLFFWRGL